MFILSEEPASCPSAHPELAALHSAVRPTQALRFSFNFNFNQGRKPEAHRVRQLRPQTQPANQNSSAGKPRPFLFPAVSFITKMISGVCLYETTEE